MKYNLLYIFSQFKTAKKKPKTKKEQKNPQKTNKQKNDIFIRFLFINIRIEKKNMQSKFYKLFILLNSIICYTS